MTQSIFITGTDTDVGKTSFAVALLNNLNAQGYKTFGIKPIASGCTTEQGILVNSDALALQAAASIKREYQTVNPIAFEPPLAPNIAAQHADIPLTKQILAEKIRNSIQLEADFNIIEGAGGWSVPLNAHELVSDAISLLKLPVILVVGIKLGCLNHAISTAELIQTQNIRLIGWVANCIDADMPANNENIQTLSHWLESPCLASIPYNADPQQHIDTNALLESFKTLRNGESYHQRKKSFARH